MPDRNALDAVRAYAKQAKEQLLDDMPPILVILRDEQPVAVMRGGGVDSLLRLAAPAAAGYGADALGLVIEGVLPLVPTNPLTGHEWARGDADSVRTGHDGVERGWVAEMQLIATALRNGPVGSEGWQYRILGGAVVWEDAASAVSLAGLTDALASRLAGPIIDPARVADPGDRLTGDPENGPFYTAARGRTVLDIGCTRAFGAELADDGEACLIVTSRGSADSVILEGLPEWQVEVFD